MTLLVHFVFVPSTFAVRNVDGNRIKASQILCELAFYWKSFGRNLRRLIMHECSSTAQQMKRALAAATSWMLIMKNGNPSCKIKAWLIRNDVYCFSLRLIWHTQLPITTQIEFAIKFLSETDGENISYEYLSERNSSHRGSAARSSSQLVFDRDFISSLWIMQWLSFPCFVCHKWHRHELMQFDKTWRKPL